MSDKTKYRILLSVNELRMLRSMLEGSSMFDVIREKFSLAIRKHEAGITRAAYIPIGQQSLEAKLGLEYDDRASTIYQSWRDGVALSKPLLESAMEYGYLNDLLSKEEIIEYEKGLISPSSEE